MLASGRNESAGWLLMALSIDDLLRRAVENKSSDLHLKVGNHPYLRVDGLLTPISEVPRITPEEMLSMAFSMMTNRQKQKFKETAELDMAYGVAGLGRFRVNVFQQRGNVGMVLRVIPTKIRTIEELNLPGVIGKAHIAIGKNADQLAGPAIAGAFDDRNPGNVMLLHQCQRIGEGGFRMDRDRVHDHAGFEFLHLPHLRGLRFRIEVAMEDADAAGLRHGDCHMRFRHRIHCRGDNRNIELNVGCDARSDIDVRRHDVGKPRLQQHVIEGVCFAR